MRRNYSRSFMFLGFDCRDLTSLRSSGPNRMALGAIHSLCTAVFAMAEDGSEHIPAGRSPAIGATSWHTLHEPILLSGV
jgi:hypothetical protein